MSLREMVWENVIKEAVYFTDNHPSVSFSPDRKGVFLEKYQAYRDEFLKMYMIPGGGQELDRHKNAAVIVRALSETRALSSKGKGKPFIANEILGVNVALSYMRESLRVQMTGYKENGARKELCLSPEEIEFILNDKSLGEYPLPTPFSCPENNYAFVLARDVYYAGEQDKVSCLTLANIFFLIDAYAIQFYKRRFLASQ